MIRNAPIAQFLVFALFVTSIPSAFARSDSEAAALAEYKPASEKSIKESEEKFDDVNAEEAKNEARPYTPPPARPSPPVARPSQPVYRPTPPAPTHYESPRVVQPAPRVTNTPAPVRNEPIRHADTPAPRVTNTPHYESPRPRNDQPVRPVVERPREIPRNTPPPAQVTLSTHHQSGIGGTYHNTELTNITKKNRDTLEGVAPNGDRIRFKMDTNGQQRITSVVKRNANGSEIKANYDATGRRTHFTEKRPDGVVIQGTVGRYGNRTLTTNYGNGTRVVSNSLGGRVERNFTSSGRAYTQRIYVNNYSHNTYVRNYYYDGGYSYYSPSWRFSNSFYTGFLFGAVWATQPVYYTYNTGWGWYGNSWIFHPYSPYSYYFVPSYSYSDPIDYVTDYVIADTLAQDYENALAAEREQKALEQQNNSLRQQVSQLQEQVREKSMEEAELRDQMREKADQALITQEIKKQISAQVRAEIQAQQNQQAVPMSSVLSDTKYLFLNTEEKSLSYTDDAGDDNECTMSLGDIFRLAAPVNPGDAVARIVIKTSKHGDDSCPVNQEMVMDVKSLESIKNEMAQRAEAGVKAAQERAGNKYEAPKSLVDTDASTLQEAQEQIRKANQISLD